MYWKTQLLSSFLDDTNELQGKTCTVQIVIPTIKFENSAAVIAVTRVYTQWKNFWLPQSLQNAHFGHNIGSKYQI